MRAADHLPPTFNAAEHFVGRHARGEHAGRLALVTDDETLDYRAFDLRVRRFAAALAGAGIHRGDRVAFVLPDSPLLAVAFWGTLALGAVAVPLNTLLTRHDHRVILADCDARLVIADPALFVANEGSPDDQVIWTPNEASVAMAAAEPLPGYAATHRDGFAFFLYSSGTTGEPKGVVHLHHDAWICCETYGQSILGIGPDDRCLSVAKIFFAYGLGNSLYFPQHVGAATVLVAERPTPETIFAAVRRHRPTLFFAVPTAYANMLAKMDAGEPHDFSSVRLCVSAGEALPGALLARWREHTGVEILDGIGSTEIGHIFLSNRAGAARPGSTGLPVKGYDLRLVDDTGADVPRGEMGDLLVRGDSIAALYWNKHEATKQAIRGEWIRTGDKYYQDDDGYYFHAGRSDDMIKAGGIWVSPVEVEAVLITHESVLECAVVGAPDADGLFKPHAYVTVRPGHEHVAEATLAETLKAFAKTHLAPFKTPRWITRVNELPKTATGKIQRFLLRAR